MILEILRYIGACRVERVVYTRSGRFGNQLPTMPYEYGIVYDGANLDLFEGQPLGKVTRFNQRKRNCSWMGISVFDSPEAREAAIRILRDDFGARYWTTYRDAQGHGLSWSMRTGQF